jgi:hypothetical protein
MAEILEKGLLIGFGLSVAIFFFSVFTPYLSIFFSENQQPLDEHDIFVYTIEYGLSYTQSEDDLHINMSLSIEVSLTLEMLMDVYRLNISSPLRSTLITSSSLIILSNSSVTGNFEVIFSYDVNLVIITFRGVK